MQILSRSDAAHANGPNSADTSQFAAVPLTTTKIEDFAVAALQPVRLADCQVQRSIIRLKA